MFSYDKDIFVCVCVNRKLDQQLASNIDPTSSIDAQLPMISTFLGNKDSVHQALRGRDNVGEGWAVGKRPLRKSSASDAETPTPSPHYIRTDLLLL